LDLIAILRDNSCKRNCFAASPPRIDRPMEETPEMAKNSLLTTTAGLPIAD
jgi:hypothetical protein